MCSTTPTTPFDDAAADVQAAPLVRGWYEIRAVDGTVGKGFGIIEGAHACRELQWQYVIVSPTESAFADLGPTAPPITAVESGSRVAFDNALKVFGWIIEQRRPAFSGRDVHRAFPHCFPTPAHVEDALADLADLGCIRRLGSPRRAPSARNPKGAGRRPSPVFEVDWPAVNVYKRAWLALLTHTR